ncbi:MAG: hypothetical protein KC620_25575 [Myxococcales bacterium]|nr:hypothetical protein [Myxococcales bacterium]
MPLPVMPRALLALALLLCLPGCGGDDDPVEPGVDARIETPDRGSADAGAMADAARPTADAEASFEGTIELGTGDDDFKPITDGEDIWIIKGPQGGYHLLGSVRVTGIDAGNPDDLDDPSNPTTAFEIWEDDERVDADVAHYTQALGPVWNDPDTFEMIGRFVILDIQSDRELAGATLRFKVSVTDAQGHTLTDAREVVGVPHPNNALAP